MIQKLEQFRELIEKHRTHGIAVLAIFIVVMLIAVCCVKCSGGSEDSAEPEMVEDHMVKYPGRTFDYKAKFNDQQARQYAVASQIGLPRPPKDRADAASMKKNLRLVHSTENYIVDSLTHSVPYLIPVAARELDAIGAEWADILQRNGLPHYRFRVTSILRTQEDIRALQRSGNINSVTQSCHCFGTTFDLAYMHYDKVTRTRDYVHEDNLKLVLGQVLLNHQRAGKIYVKYEWKQSCFHITVRE